MYADAYLKGVRDPARHDAATLEEFCANHGVPALSAGEMGAAGTGMGASSSSDQGKDVLVQRIKAYQKGGSDRKEAWGAFAGSTKDPARHDVSKLLDFIALYDVP